jgi:Phage integrase, N-terminal SAM-like domain
MGEYAALVVARRRLRPATAALYAKLLRLTILPTWANRPLDDITAAEISTWYAGMQNTPTQQANAYGLLKSIFKEAIEEGILEANPCRVKAGGQKQRAREIGLLTGQVAIASAATAARAPG